MVCPRFAATICPLKHEGAGNAGCALHPRSRVQICARKTHTSIQVQRRQSGIPCAMALRLMPCSPRRRIRLVTVAAGLRLKRSGWIDLATDSLTPATGVGTTRFCRTQQPVFAKRLRRARRRSSARRSIAHGLIARPAITCAPDAAASTASHPNVRDVRDTPLVRGQDGRVSELIWVRRKRKYFCERGWTRQITLIRFSKFTKARGLPVATPFRFLDRVDQRPLLRGKPDLRLRPPRSGK